VRKVQIVSLLFVCSLLPQLCSAQQTQPDVEARVDSLLKQLTLQEKIDLISGVDNMYIRAIPHIGLPSLKMSDGPVGVRNYGPATTVFGGIALAATWDPEMAHRIGAAIGQDARARGVHFMLGPGVNIYRAPMCGRNFEYFGEDPYLAAQTAVGYIEGMQEQGVSATIKHYIGNNQEYDRRNIDDIIDERTMREIYLPAFEAAVKEAHVGAIMDSYNLINGVHMSQNGYLNIDVAKKEWGFSGILMSDWGSTYDGIAAANNGLDLEMPSGKFMNRATLLPAIQAGKVTTATVDDKVRRILRTAIRFGWLDREQTELSIPLLNPQGTKAALEAARASMVLLKNDGGILPLNKTQIKSIAVIGPDAYPAAPGAGGSAEAKPFTAVSYLEGIANYLGAAKVYYERGIPSLEDMAKQTHFTTEASGGEPGLKAEFYTNADLSGSPAMTRVDKFVDFQPYRWAKDADADASVRWTGYFAPTSAGKYLIFVQGPGETGGYRLYIDKKLVFDDWKAWYAFVSETFVDLAPGPHLVELESYVNQGWHIVPVAFGIVRPDDLVSTAAKALASRADAVVLAMGFDASNEGESADRLFQLPPGQDELINAIAAVNKKTVVVVTSGGSVDMSAWVDRVPALLESWYSGEEGGSALAQLLFGEFNPSGRLPISFERRWEDAAVHDTYYPKNSEKKVAYSEGVFVGYRHFDKSGIKPLFPFGYGLSYSTFGYKNLTVSPAQVSHDQPVNVAFDLTNTGNRTGADVAEIYVGDRHAPVPRPRKELKAFKKVDLKPGETKHVEVSLDRRAFSYYDVKSHRWTVAPGDFDVYVGRSSVDIQLTGKVSIQ